MMQWLLFIGSLKTGGAERQILHLARGLKARGHSVTLVTLFPTSDEAHFDDTKPLLQPLALFQERRGSRVGRFLQILWAPFAMNLLMKRLRPDVVYSMLYLSNLITVLARPVRRGPKLVWGLRASDLRSDWRRSIPFHLCRVLSIRTDLVIANSQRGLDYHLSAGYRNRRFAVVRNGIDTHKFRYDAFGRKMVRQEWGLEDNEVLIGLVGRFDPQKGHKVFFNAAQILSREIHNLRFVCLGPGEGEIRQCLKQAITELGLEERFLLEKGRIDMASTYSAIDVVVSASTWGEGFSNVIGEAMSCERTCVVTDVGDSAKIVGDTGIVIAPSDPDAMVEAIKEVLSHSSLRNENARHRVVTEFSVNKMVAETESAVMGVLVRTDWEAKKNG